MSVCIVAAFAAEYPRPAYPAYEKAYNYVS